VGHRQEPQAQQRRADDQHHQVAHRAVVGHAGRHAHHAEAGQREQQQRAEAGPGAGRRARRPAPLGGGRGQLPERRPDAGFPEQVAGPDAAGAGGVEDGVVEAVQAGR
jgi:hypothetical protein